MSKSKFEVSKEAGEHYRLSLLAGNWAGTTRTWFEADVLADESPASGTIKQYWTDALFCTSTKEALAENHWKELPLLVMTLQTTLINAHG